MNRFLLLFSLLISVALADVDYLLKIKIGTSDLSANADGMYALVFDDLNKIAGPNIQGIKVSQLKMFTASPDTLPEAIGANILPPKTEEIPIKVEDKNGNGIFDSGDTIIFFGFGTAIWKKSASVSGMDYYFSHSPYSFYQYFYLAAGTTDDGKRFLNKTNNIAVASDVNWKKYKRSEREVFLRDNYFGKFAIEENTGREWFWSFDGVNDFQNSVKNLDGLSGDSIYLGVSFFPRRSTQANRTLSEKTLKERMKNINFNFNFQGNKLTNIKDTAEGGTFVFAGKGAKATDNLYSVKINIQDSTIDRFDGLSVAYKYDVSKSAGDEWLLTGKPTSANIKIPIPSGMELIKVVDFIPQEEIIEGNGDNIDLTKDTKYFLHKKNSYKTVEKENIEVISATRPLNVCSEYLIITSNIFLASAEKLKQFRESNDAVKRFGTSIVLTEDIFRDYGAQPSPVAIRDYLRYAKNNCNQLKYVLLAGNGNYDYRKIRPNSRENIIPPYEIEDYSSDDFFAVLNAGEGVRFGTYNELSLSIGRLPVSTVIEFENYIEKIKDYEQVSIMDNGAWRNSIIFNADDATQGSQIDGIRHTARMESTTSAIDKKAAENNFAIDWKKISLLQYEKDGSGKKPVAAKELLLRLNQGALFTFYYGHGNAVQWADEDLLNTSSLNGLYNKSKYTILGSFSCLVARFDDAATISLSEVFVTAKSKGAIASIGSLRESYAGYNENIARKILENSLFAPNILLGDAIKKAKETYAHSEEKYNNEKYVLLGEPVLSMPIQGIALSIDKIDTIQALQKLTISGTATNAGRVRLQVLEGERQKFLSQNNCADPTYCTANMNVPGTPFYSEEIQVKNGRFQTEFITPRKLSLGDTAAQIRAWAYTPQNPNTGRKAIRNIHLEGVSSYADSINDKTAPIVRIFPCVRSGTVTPYAENAQIKLEIPACVEVEVEDETGIDYREQADEGISFEFSPIMEPWHPWSFSEQTGKRAVARMEFEKNFDPGEYVFKVKAQDIMGNLASRTLRISLDQESGGGLMDVFNAPNPMKKNGTTFYFKNLSGEQQSRVRIKVFNQNGKLVKTFNNVISGETKWDGRDERGRMLANGLYHYIVQVTLTSEGKKKTFEKKQKLLISK